MAEKSLLSNLNLSGNKLLNATSDDFAFKGNESDDYQTISLYGARSYAYYLVTHHSHDFSSITNKPTTLSGYGITDAALSSHTHNYLSTLTVGSTSYSVTSNGITIPAYPTTLPANDVYSWAKQSSKPSYSTSEVSEGDNLYFTNARAVSALSSTLSGYSLISHTHNYTSTVKLGTTSYNVSSNIISLPSYPTSLPASDVSSWAKATSKPSYTSDEVTEGTTNLYFTNARAVSALSSTLSGYSTTSHTHNYLSTLTIGTTAYNVSSNGITIPAYPTSLPASDVYSWAKQSSKPSYSYSEVGAAASSHTHNYLSTLTVGSTAYSVSSNAITIPAYPTTLPASDVYSWAKQSSKPSYSTSEITNNDSTVKDSAYLATGVNTVTTLASLPIDKGLIYATLSAATNISLASALSPGQCITIMITPSAAITQPIPTTGGFTSLDGDSLSLASGKMAEISIACYATGTYLISSKAAS